MQENILDKVINSEPIFEPTFFVNVDYYFNQVLVLIRYVRDLRLDSTVYIISYLLSLFGLTILIYGIIRTVEIQTADNRGLKNDIAEAIRRQKERAGTGNERWERIQDLLSAPNESDWKLSIIEADTVLHGLLEARGIPGEHIGEKLKNITPGDLSSLQAAWEAHLVRNRIAHEVTFELTQRDARRTIQLYEVVFRELGFVN